jgi:hypothetical protein
MPSVGHTSSGSKQRNKDDLLFSDFKFLADHMMDRETGERQTARSQVALNEKEIKEFLFGGILGLIA